MARRKKEVIEGKVESHIDAVDIFIKHCYRDGEVVSISPKFNETYQVNGLSYTFTKAVRDSMVESGKVKMTHENDTEVHFMGIST